MDRQGGDKPVASRGGVTHRDGSYRQSNFEDMGVALPQAVEAETVPEQQIMVGRERESGFSPHPEPAECDWPLVPPRLRPILSEQGGYPSIPGEVGRVVEAFHRKSGCSRPVAALLTMASLSTLAAGDWNVQSMAPDPKPLTFHVLGISESGWRKSTAMRMIWQPHEKADREVDTEWREASDLIKALPSGEWPPSMLPRSASPKLMRSALKVADMKNLLRHGRPCQAQVCDGSAELLKLAFSKTNLRSALQFLCETFDGSPLSYDGKQVGTINGYRHLLAVVGPMSELLGVICHPAAQDGFSGRCLVAKDDRRPMRPGAIREEDQNILHRYCEAVLAHRRRQDKGIHLETTTWRDPVTIELDPEARPLLERFQTETEAESDTLRDRGALHQAALAVRAAEVAARIAGVLAAAEWYIQHPDGIPGPEDVHVGVVEIATAFQVVRFHLEELGRLLSIEAKGGEVDAANSVIDWVREELGQRRKGGDARHIDERGRVWVTRLINDRVRRGRLRDPEFRRAVVAQLVQQHYLAEVPGQGGRFWTHPALASVEKVDGVDKVE